MKRFAFAVGFAALAICGQAGAQALPAASSPVDQHGWNGDQWINVAKSIDNGKSVVGKPIVYMLNATGRTLVLVKCQAWVLVGPKPYIDGNPAELPAWKSTLVSTKGFDGYCQQGLQAQDEDGSTYRGALVSADGTFSNATFITFYKPNS